MYSTKKSLSCNYSREPFLYSLLTARLVGLHRFSTESGLLFMEEMCATTASSLHPNPKGPSTPVFRTWDLGLGNIVIIVLVLGKYSYRVVRYLDP